MLKFYIDPIHLVSRKTEYIKKISITELGGLPSEYLELDGASVVHVEYDNMPEFNSLREKLLELELIIPINGKDFVLAGFCINDYFFKRGSTLPCGADLGEILSDSGI